MFQFEGLFPTMNQCRWISTATFVSRVFAAEDKNELRETTIRDALTYSSLYFLGDYVSKGVATVIEKVNPMHPDKIADRIAGAIVDMAYSKAKNPKVAKAINTGHIGSIFTFFAVIIIIFITIKLINEFLWVYIIKNDSVIIK